MPNYNISSGGYHSSAVGRDDADFAGGFEIHLLSGCFMDSGVAVFE